MKKLIIFFLFLIILLAAGTYGAYAWYNKQLTIPASTSTEQVEVEIEKGENIKSIAIKLQTAGVIKSSDIFYFYIKFNNLAPKIQAGKFKIPQNLTVLQVASTLQRAAGNDIWVTIPEGLRLDEIAEVLDEYFLKEENTRFSKEQFLAIVQDPDKYNLNVSILQYKPAGSSLEGFLFPDTYNVAKDISSEQLIKLLLTTLDNKLKEEQVDLTTHPTLKPYEVIVLASILERESRKGDERYMVADILQKRLDGKLDGVKLLQADATLLYEEKNWEAVITRELKEKDTPYNTYKYTGLTPTPICNPGLESIKAALRPASNDFFFYLHDDQGKIHYGKTLNDHNNNVRCYINKNTDYCL